VHVAVTGGTGFVGAHIVAALVDAGHRVRLLARSADTVASTVGALGVPATAYQVTSGDVCDPGAIDRLLDGVDALVHAAGVVGVDDRREQEMRRVNVDATTAILAGAAGRGLDPIVHLSSYSALFPAATALIGPDTPPAEGRSAYARTKSAAERAARALQDDGAPVTILYPAGIVGPPAGPRRGLTAEAWAPLLRFGISLSFEGATALIDVRDVADLTEALMVPGRGPRRLVCGGELMRFDQLVDVLAEGTGRRVRRIRVRPATVLRIGRAADAVSRVLPVPPVLTYEAAWILTTAQGTDDRAALEALGRPWRPARQALLAAVGVEHTG
jgi:dihydroflavonol-4-reductase